MSKEKQNFANSLASLKLQYQQLGINEENFNKIYCNSLARLEILEKEKSRKSKVRSRLVFDFFSKNSKIIFPVVFLLAVTVYNGKSAYSFVMCNVQEHIYPGLRILRRLSIPLISLFPSITEWYDETCLLQNPFFTVVDMDCWPCTSVSSIHEISDTNLEKQHSASFIYKTNQQLLELKDLEKMYLSNKGIFSSDASQVLVDGKYYINPETMFNLIDDDQKAVYLWKFNRMRPSHLLRYIIPRPKIIPKFGQSTERFLIIENSQKTYKLPDTECNFAFVLFVKGSRTVELVPAEECKNQCKSLKIFLKESYLLCYNWWYWRPVIEPAMNKTLIAHVGSYC